MCIVEASMADHPSADLARFVAGLRYETIPAAVRERVKDLLLDALASALAGRQGDEVSQIQALASALGASSEASIIGGACLSLAGATMLNAYLVTAVTVCDVHRPTLYHTTPEVVPPALAVAERAGASGKALLVALAAGLETSVRVALGTNYPVFRARGWHSPGVVGPFGGAAAAGSLLGLDADAQNNAFGLAGSQSAGTFAHWGTPTIKFHQCRGALSGLMAALLAQQGFRASSEILTHPDGGIYNAYSDGGKPEIVTANLGHDWMLQQIALRLWPAGSSIQTAMTALFALVQQHDLRPATVQQVDIALSRGVYDMHGTLPWSDKFKALLSAPYVAGIILHDRRCWLDQFAPDRLQDPGVDAFVRERVKVSADPALQGTAARVSIRTSGGAVYVDERRCAKGDPDDPLTRAEIEDKLRIASRGVLTDAQVQAIIDDVSRLEALHDARTLTATLRSGAA
jgi:2-methylcitrate dehydratase PrpD